MIRRVRKKTLQSREKSICSRDDVARGVVDGTCEDREYAFGWTSLPDDILIAVFSRLNYRDRASLASVCKAWRRLGASPCLWTSLDIRAHSLDSGMASSLSDRCVKLQRLRFRTANAAGVIINLQARELRELIGDGCRDVTDASLVMLAARHAKLESLQLGSDCDRITSEGIKVMALCCPKLSRLRLSGVRDVEADAIQALVKHC
eukprot:c19748_g2_i1 orf=3-614(-)